MVNIDIKLFRRNLAATTGPSKKHQIFCGTPFLVLLGFIAPALTAQETLPAIAPVDGKMLKECEAPLRTTFNRAECVAPGLRAGSWNLQPLSAIWAEATVNGRTTYATEPLPVPSVAAELDLQNCVGPAKLVVDASGHEVEISPGAELSEKENVHAVYEGTGIMRVGGGVGYKTKVDITAQDAETAYMFFELSNPPVGVGHGDIVFEMLYAGPSEDQVHPYCDCRAQLRAFLDERISLYESLSAMFEDQSLWYPPSVLDPNISYDYGTYYQFALMVHQRGLTPDQVSGCFNAQLKLKPEDQIAAFLRKPGISPAATSPESCAISYSDDAPESCYPEIDLENYQRHEGVHQKECLSTEGAPSSPGAGDQTPGFAWLNKVDNFQAIPPRFRDNGRRAVLNSEIQALAETEIRAYQESLEVYRGWEEENCGSE